jgi:phenylacetaldehyde dehydrogenase
LDSFTWIRRQQVQAMGPKLRNSLKKHGITQEAASFLAESPRMYVDGGFVQGESDATSVLIEPCTGDELLQVGQASLAQVDAAVASARTALEGPWGRLRPSEREALMQRLADLLERDAQILAELEALNAGKALTGCRAVDVGGSIALLRYMAGWATKIEGATRTVSAEGTHFAYTRKEAIGVVAAIVPWNWPLSMAIWKLAAPLAAGCTVVLKPSEITPVSVLYLARLCEEAGFPRGVVNVVTGPGATIGSRLCSYPGIDKVSFTGSTAVGREVGSAAIAHFAHVTLELGGKSPMLVFPDADVARVVEATQRSVFFNAGQVCSAGSRLYVHRAIHDEVVNAIAQRASQMKLGFSLDPRVEMGPVISAKQRDKIAACITQGEAEGATLVCGGKPDRSGGFFIPPTVFVGCDNSMSVVREEIFGPVLAVVPFDDADDPIALANDNDYGLGASVFTADISRALNAVPRIKAGTVWINTHDYVDCCMPFGGFKDSGIGKDLGPEQLAHYLQTKTVWIKI